MNLLTKVINNINKLNKLNKLNKKKNIFPCKDCLILPMCKSKVLNKDQDHILKKIRINKLTRSCELLKDYLYNEIKDSKNDELQDRYNKIYKIIYGHEYGYRDLEWK